MKQLLILSGKGGTGKTTLASAFIKLSKAEAYADCDVDAPNLHLLGEMPKNLEKAEYYGLPKAKINQDICTKCGLCEKACRFNAIKKDAGYKVEPLFCEGCAVCRLVCPAGAVTLIPNVSGELMLYKNESSVFSTAQLKTGAGNSGLLVSEVKKRMKSAAPPETKFAVIDGSPGIGCPVIASLSGADMVLVTAEPSISGFSDMERIIKTARGFQTEIAVCVNKYDTNIEKTQEIKDFCDRENIHFCGIIPFDSNIVDAVNNGLTVIDIESAAKKAVITVYENTKNILFQNNKELAR